MNLWEDKKMRLYRMKSVYALIAIASLLLIPVAVKAQAVKTTVATILANPDQYDGKMVEVAGQSTAIKSKTSRKGNPYTTFKVTDNGNTLSVFSFGTLPIKDGDSVRVRGRYQKVKHVPPSFTFYNEIDASEGGVEKR